MSKGGKSLSLVLKKKGRRGLQAELFSRVTGRVNTSRFNRGINNYV